MASVNDIASQLYVHPKERTKIMEARVLAAADIVGAMSSHRL